MATYNEDSATLFISRLLAEKIDNDVNKLLEKIDNDFNKLFIGQPILNKVNSPILSFGNTNISGFSMEHLASQASNLLSYKTITTIEKVTDNKSNIPLRKFILN